MYFDTKLPKDLLWGVYLNEGYSDLKILKEMHVTACQIALHPGEDLHALLQACLQAHITPILTISYGDYLKDLGNWEERSIIKRFVDYVEKVYTAYKDQVHHFVIFDQPHFLPDTSLSKLYQVMHYIFVAQAQAVLCLKAHDPSLCVGSMVNDIVGLPHARPLDALALSDYNEIENYSTMDIYGYGRYPALVRRYLASQDIQLDMTLSDRQVLKQAAALTDFMGLHYEMCVLVGFNSLSGSYTSGILGAYQISSGRRDPLGLRLALRTMTSRYDCPILVNFHLKEHQGDDDFDTIDDLREHVKEMKKAVGDGSQILGFMIDQTNIFKKSSAYYKHLIMSNGEEL